MAENPFEILGDRLAKIEDLLQQLSTSPVLPGKVTKDIGGLEIAVEETGLSTHSIYRLVSERKLPHSKRGGRLYFSRNELRKWIEQGQRATS